MIYKFKTGCRFRKECDPQMIGERLEQVRVAHDGKLLIDDVLVEAADVASPLNPVFTWDDTKAAYNWREQEARQLVRSVVVLKAEDAEPELAFWNVRVQVGEEQEQYYQSIAVLEQSPQEYHAALTLLLGQLDALDHSIKALRRVTPNNQTRQVDSARGFLQRAKDILNP